MKTIDQAVLDEIIKIGRSLKVNIYPNLPDFEVPYPFGVVSSIQRLPNVTKTHKKALFAVNLQVFGSINQRKDVSTLLAQLWDRLSEFKLGKYSVVLDESTANHQIVELRESQTLTLWRGVFSFELIIR